MNNGGLKKELIRIIGIVIIIIIVGYFFFFAWFPLILTDPPLLPLYNVANFSHQNHNLTITILNSNNKTILSQSYNIQPNKSIKYNRGFGWYPTITIIPFTWSEGKYTFYAVLDGNFSDSLTTTIDINKTISVIIGLEIPFLFLQGSKVYTP